MNTYQLDQRKCEALERVANAIDRLVCMVEQKYSSGRAPNGYRGAGDPGFASTEAWVVNIQNPSTPLPDPKPIVVPVPSGDPRFTRTELDLSPGHIREWQSALLVAPDGKLGDHHSETREAIRAYLISLPNGGRAASDNSDASFEIGPREEVLLNILAEFGPATTQRSALS